MSRNNLQLNLFFYALAALCSLASVVFVTFDARPRAYVAIVGGFVFGVIAVRPDTLPDPVWVGGVVACLAVIALRGDVSAGDALPHGDLVGDALKGVPYRASGGDVFHGVPHRRKRRTGALYLVAAGGGALAGIWVAMLQVAGTPVAAATVVAVLPVALSVVFTRQRADFAPPALREEALLVVLMLGVAVAVAPGIVAGWQSAAVLNRQPQDVASQIVPMWTLLVTLGAAVVGGLSTVWMRR